MKNAVSDNVRSLFAGRGIDLTKADNPDLVIDRFDNWTNAPKADVWGCVTGACTISPPLAEAS